MKKIFGIIILTGICLFFSAYTFANEDKVGTKNDKIESAEKRFEKQDKTDKGGNKNWMEKLQDKIFKSKTKVEEKNEKEVSKQKNSEYKVEKKQRSGSIVPCNQKSGFIEKLNLMDNNISKKISMLDKINLSLEGIIPLVKDSGTKKSLGLKIGSIQKMKKNYLDLNSKIDKQSSDVCDVPALLKQYNEETKVIIEEIKGQLKLLKK